MKIYLQTICLVLDLFEKDSLIFSQIFAISLSKDKYLCSNVTSKSKL
jgi:hypothetical protein